MAEPERYIHHFTLTTGHSRKTARSEVKQDLLDELRFVFAHALAERGKIVAIPRTPECAITATSVGRAVLATIWGTNTKLHTWGRAHVPLLTMGVAADQDDGTRLWRILHEEKPSDVCTSVAHKPEEPWIAIRLEFGLTLYRDAGQWLEHLERAAAWAWIESSSEENRCAQKLELAPEAL